MELLVRTDIFVFLEHILQTYVVEGVEVDSQEDDYLAKEGNSKPRVPDGMGGSNVGYLSEGLGVGEEVEIDGGKYAQHEGLGLRVL